MAVVTVSRQFGAGGWSLGKRLCDRFGFELITEDVIDNLARKEKVSPDWLKAVELEASSKLLGAISNVFSTGLFYRSPSVEAEGYEQKRYIDFLTRLLGAMADRGGYVIVGRGGQFVLRHHPKAVHVMLAGEFDDRVRFMMETYSLSLTEAEQSIRAKEKQRASVAAKIFEMDVDDPKLYHLILNTSLMPFDWAVETVVDLVSKFMAKEGDRR